MDLGLRGLKAVVTGGSKGIGRAIVETLAVEGCAVEFCARNSDGVERVAAEFVKRGLSVRGTALDVRDASSVTSWLNQIAPFNIFIPNVSALSDDWATTLTTDVTATVEVTQRAAVILAQSAHAAITFIGSKTASYAAPHSPPYGAMKAAMAHYMKSLAVKCLPHIRVNVVSPGDIVFTDGYWDRVSREDPALFKAVVERNPMGRLGSPNEIARVVAFISSPAAQFVAGANWYVDGGSVRHVQF